LLRRCRPSSLPHAIMNLRTELEGTKTPSAATRRTAARVTVKWERTVARRRNDEDKGRGRLGYARCWTWRHLGALWKTNCLHSAGGCRIDVAVGFRDHGRLG